ncbi:MAG: alpha/beta hydrolase [Microthrixaceae bacterium]
MTKVLVHGNPESSAVWGPLLDQLAHRGVDDVVCLSPPGFGAPLGERPPRSPQDYRDWLIGELERCDRPVDLVGHDWGAGHLYAVLAQLKSARRGELVRTWTADVAGLLHADYEWHEMGQLWQTPEVGEQVVAAMAAMDVAERAEGYVGMGVTPDAAADMAAAMNDDMGSSILSLYRGAAQPYMADLGRKLAGEQLPPGLVVLATEDTFAGTDAMTSAVAADLGADVLRLEGAGHWWMCQRPDAAADALVAHWADADVIAERGESE